MQNQYRNVLVVSPQIISVILICFIVLFSANLQTKLFFCGACNHEKQMGSCKVFLSFCCKVSGIVPRATI